MGKNTPARKDDIMENLVVTVEEQVLAHGHWRDELCESHSDRVGV